LNKPIKCNILFVLLLLSSMAFLSCGKNLKVVDNPDGPNIDPLDPGGRASELREIVKKQEVVCEENQPCNESIAKIIFFDKSSRKPKFCTGFLTSDRTIVTSAKCLPKHLRIPLANCSDDIYFIFPKIGDHEMEIVRCDKVISSTYVDDDNQDPALLGSDAAYLLLGSRINRNAFRISYSGLDAKWSYSIWKVDHSVENISVIRKETCSPVFNSYANPFSVSRYSPNIVLSGCEHSAENTGAPVVDNYGRVRGILSNKLSGKTLRYLEDYTVDATNRQIEVSNLTYVSNMACAISPGKELSFKPHEDCYVQLDQRKLEIKRRHYLNQSEIHKRGFEKTVEQFKKNRAAYKYVNWDINFIRGSFGKWITEISPLCFNNYSSWSKKLKKKKTYNYYFDYAFAEFQLRLDEELVAYSVKSNEYSNETKIHFQPRNIRDNNRSYLYVKGANYGNGYSRCTE
jgi:hypothetical protein